MLTISRVTDRVVVIDALASAVKTLLTTVDRDVVKVTSALINLMTWRVTVGRTVTVPKMTGCAVNVRLGINVIVQDKLTLIVFGP